MTSINQSYTGARELSRQARYKVIVQIATRYFIEHGYNGTTMSGIAGALGGSKGTLWSYFPSKQQLFIAVIDRMTTEFQNEMTQILKPGSNIEQTLFKFCRELVTRITSSDALALYRLVLSESSRFPEIGKVFFERGPARIHKLLADFLGSAMDQQSLCVVDPARAAHQLIRLCTSGSRQDRILGIVERVTSAEIELDVTIAMDIFLRAYSRR